MADPTVTGAAAATPDITLYWLNQSRSQRILWLLEELSLPYTLSTSFRTSGKLAPASAQSIHPLGKYPMLSLNGRVLAESGLIIETLVERYGPQLMPDREDEEEWLRYRYYMHYTEGSFMIPLLVGLVLKGIREAPVPFFLKPVTRMIVSRVS
jgi:glutathione S-transferase